jgi:hypothetical protein
MQARENNSEWTLVKDRRSGDMPAAPQIKSERSVRMAAFIVTLPTTILSNYASQTSPGPMECCNKSAEPSSATNRGSRCGFKNKIQGEKVPPNAPALPINSFRYHLGPYITDYRADFGGLIAGQYVYQFGRSDDLRTRARYRYLSAFPRDNRPLCSVNDTKAD